MKTTSSTLEPKVPAVVKSRFSDELASSLVELRRDLHRHPELAFQEEQTSARLEKELSAVHPAKLDRVAGTGLVARIEGQDSGAPVVAIRGDMDALPIEEDTGLAYTSENVGVMHACGHDVHATWTVGAAHLLAAEPCVGDVLVVLQPAEEIGAGAEKILASGALDGVATIFGGHVDRRFAVGEVVADEGPVAASADTYDITLRGFGGHGARPHEGSDPIVGAGALITALQTIVSRRLNPADAGVVTIGKMQAGTAHNIIPDTATISGTLRAVKPETRNLLHEQVQRIAQGIAEAHGLEATVDLHWNCPPIVNTAEPVAMAREGVTQVLGAQGLVPLPYLNMGGEDFAFYLEKIPGCFMRIGAREDGGDVISAHSPKFYAAEECIFVGAAVLAETARVASARLASGA